MITATVTELLAVQKSQLDYYGQQLSAPAAAELRRRIAARTTHYSRPDMTIEVAYAEIPRGGDIELERDRILEILNRFDPLVLMDMTEADIASLLTEDKKAISLRPDPANIPVHVMAHRKMKHFMSPQQWKHVGDLMKESVEEHEFFREKMIELAGVIDAMPRTGQADGDDPNAILHYFKGSADWFITELDVGADDDTPEQFMSQCYGYARLFRGGGECGYISLREATENGAELDFHWKPKPLSQCKDQD